MERPIPYRGEEGYIFISYAHRDAGRVWPIVAQMQLDGYRVWYDDGIDPGTEWDENIAAHVTGCGYFIAFLSKNYLASNNCKDELNYSRDQGKPQLLIYLEDVELPSGMAMRLGRNQAIFYDCYPQAADFFTKLYEDREMAAFQGENTPAVPQSPGRLTAQTFRIKKKSSLWPVWAAVILIAAALLTFLFWPKDKPKAADPLPAQTEATQVPQVTPVKNVVLADTKELNVVALDTSVDSRYFTLTLAVTNKNHTDLNLYHKNFYLNGVLCEATWYGTVSAGETVIMDLIWEKEVIASYGVDPEAVTLIEGELYGSLTDNSAEIETHSFVYYPYGEENATLLRYIPDEDDVVLLDTQDFFIAATDNWINKDNAWVQQIVCVNRHREDMMFSVEEEAINRYHVQTGWLTWVASDRMAYGEITFGQNLWQPTNYEQLLSYTGQWYIFNWTYNFSGENIVTYPFTHYPQGKAAAETLSSRQLSSQQLLFEDSTLRAGYLGTWDFFNMTQDLVYVQNTADVEYEIMVNLHSEGGTGYGCYQMQPGEEAVIACDRTPGSSPQTLTAQFLWTDPQGNRFHRGLEIPLAPAD